MWKRKGYAKTVVLGVGVALLASACSPAATPAPTSAPSAVVTSAPSQAASTAPSASGAAPSASGTAASCADTAAQRVQTATQPIQLQLPSDPVAMSKISGKSVWYIAPVLSIPFIAAIAKGFTDAANAAGLKPTVFDGKGNVDTFNQGVQSAVDAHANGIMLQGINPALVSGPLAKAQAAGIKVIDSLNGGPDQPLPASVLGHATVSYGDGGKLMADWVLADSKCNAEVALITHTIYTVYGDMVKGFQDEFASLCPACKIDSVENLTPDQIATGSSTLASTLIQRFPNLNYLVPVDDVTASTMSAAVQAASRPVKVVSHDGALPNIDQIRADNVPQKANVSNPPNESMGWAQIDLLGRLLAGQPTVPEILPQQTFTKDNVGTDDANLFPGYANYQAAYKKLWGMQ